MPTFACRQTQKPPTWLIKSITHTSNGGESVSQTEIQMDLEPSRKSTLVPLNQCLIATEIQMDFVPSPPSQAMM